VARVIKNVTAAAMDRFMRETIQNDVSLLATDDHRSARYIKNKGWPTHGVVNHSKHNYVVGAIHTNTIEGFWSILKRGVMGTYHKASRKYLPQYVAEFQFLYNNRESADIFAEAIRGC
jgi:hypothetical protein